MTAAHTAFERPLTLFFLSAVWGLAVAYDPAMAAPKFALVAGALLLAVGLGRLPQSVSWHGRNISLLRIIVGSTPALIAIYFLATNDWAQPTEKVSWLDPLQRGLAATQIRLPVPTLHANVAGGVLAMLLPLQAAALFVRRQGKPRTSIGSTAVRLAVLALSGAALLASRLRGAWAALAIAGALWLIWCVYRWFRRTNRGGERARLFALVGGLIAILLFSATWLALWIGTRPDRLIVWRNSWHLACDYALTGLGLGSFTMPYSSYALLVHVPHTSHAHNLFLDVWLEQGIVGLAAFAWILAAAVVGRTAVSETTTTAPHARAEWWHPAALISTIVLILHGAIDDSYYGYGGAGTLLLFVPVTLLSRHLEPVRSRQPQPVMRSGRILWSFAAAGSILIAALPSVRALYHANMGALLQTRIELALYRRPGWVIQDAVRRSEPGSLAPALEHYRAALGLDASNPVANRRLGQIELSLGEYERARAHLEVAYRAEPRNHATRQMIGESLALTDDAMGAARMWETIPLFEDQLAIRRAWYESCGDPMAAQRFRDAIAQTLSACR